MALSPSPRLGSTVGVNVTMIGGQPVSTTEFANSSDPIVIRKFIGTIKPVAFWYDGYNFNVLAFPDSPPVTGII